MSRGKIRTAAEICADCGAPDPSWASINRGALICDECCSVHRSLGRHISQVKSLKRGQWVPTQLAMVQQLYANSANNIWEHSLLDPSQNKHGRKKPSPRDPLHPTKHDFIRAKYQFLSFVNKHKDGDTCNNTVDDLSKQLHSSVRTNNLETSLRLLSKGADPNYYHPEKGNCTMHVAAQEGQITQVELLVIYGADPGALDVSGKTPIDYARAKGHTDLADRLIECQYELTDRLAFYLCGRKPEHRSGQHFIIPEMAESSLDLSELAKQAKKKLQALPNHMFEELAMDVYDEVDRRENDALWMSSHDHTSIVSDRQTVPFLPVNPELSATRNQGRQKLARFNAREFATLIIDILSDAKRRQAGLLMSPSHTPRDADISRDFNDTRSTIKSCSLSDDEPLYDSVASDEDYSSIDTQSIRSMRDDTKKDKSMDNTIIEQVEGPVSTEEYLQLKKSLIASEAKVQTLMQINKALSQEVTQLQIMVKRMMSENSSLREERVPREPPRIPNGIQEAGNVDSIPRRQVNSSGSSVRPQSMFEPRGQLRPSQTTSSKEELPSAISLANIHVIKVNQSKPNPSSEQKSSNSEYYDAPSVSTPEERLSPPRQDPHITRISRISKSGSASSSDGGMMTATGGGSSENAESDEDDLPSQEEVGKKTEKITKKIQELLLSAQDGKIESFGPCSTRIHSAVREMALIFPPNMKTDSIRCALQLLTISADRLMAECRNCPPPITESDGFDPRHKAQMVIQCAFDIAKAAKQLVTLFQ